ncbi:MAG TPA: hypothetical protein P5514_06680 [Bacteroidales bacterium]|nr:hypothetical protein [Bacteroidales bacterium]
MRSKSKNLISGSNLCDNAENESQPTISLYLGNFDSMIILIAHLLMMLVLVLIQISIIATEMKIR